MAHYSNNSHFNYLEVHRHWSPESEHFAGGDCLVTALNDGWGFNDDIYVEEFWHAGMRHVVVYHFELTRGTEAITMPVICNPYIDRVVSQLELNLHPLDEKTEVRRTQTRNGSSGHA